MGDTKDLEKHVPRKQLSHAKTQKEKVLRRQNMSGAEWEKAHNEAEIKYVRADPRYQILIWASYKNILLTARNEKVARDLRHKYASYFEPGSLPVYCVDNRMYHTCRNTQEALLSGIPGLRKFCYSIPAKAQFRAGSHYMGTQLPSLISSIELWVEAARDPEMQALAKIVPTKSLSSVWLFSNDVKQIADVAVWYRSLSKLRHIGGMSLKVPLTVSRAGIVWSYRSIIVIHSC